MSTFKPSKEYKSIANLKQIRIIADGYRAQGLKVIATMGVWDMIHDGHILYIERGRSLGDKLFVGIDSDDRTKKNKGEDRPFDPYESRSNVVASLSAVDHVYERDLDEADKDFVAAVQPDILVMSLSSTQYNTDKGKSLEEDFRSKFVGEGLAKEIVMLKPQSTRSTTGKMRKLRRDGGKELSNILLDVIKSYMEENGEDKS